MNCWQKINKPVVIAILLLSTGLGLFGQAPNFGTIDGTIACLYRVISGPASAPRDAAVFEALFLPSARLYAVAKDSMGKEVVREMKPMRFFKGMQKYTSKNGFFESEINRKTERFDQIAHVWSTYESRHSEAEDQPFARGINSIQLFFDGSRWWVSSIYWQDERPNALLPKKYLPKKQRRKRSPSK